MSFIALPYVYKITNIYTNQFYIGSRVANKLHHSEDLGIKYFTSSNYVKNLGFENFKINWIEEFDNPNVAYKFEQLIIFELLKDPLCLNKVCHFGKPRFSIAGKKSSKETKAKISKHGKARISISNGIHEKHINKFLHTVLEKDWYYGRSKKTLLNISKSLKGHIKSKESIEKMIKAVTGSKRSKHACINLSEAKRGSKNPCYGKKCITNGIINKYISLHTNFKMPEGYKFGLTKGLKNV